MKIGVVIAARNEEGYLGKTLQHLLNQTLRPEMIVVVDDGSSDRTAEIATQYGVVVLRRRDKRYSSLGLHKARNVGLRFLDEINGFDYVMILDADQLLSKTYIQKIVTRMEKDRSLVIASGEIVGEPSRAPRGSGRVYRFDLLREMGYFPINYGSESYPLYKALKMGYKVEVFRDALSLGQRPTSLSSRKLYIHGKGMKALGCDPLYFSWEFLLKFLDSPKGALSMLIGYFFSDVQKYSDLNIGEWQRRMLLKRLVQKIKSMLTH